MICWIKPKNGEYSIKAEIRDSDFDKKEGVLEYTALRKNGARNKGRINVDEISSIEEVEDKNLDEE